MIQQTDLSGCALYGAGVSPRVRASPSTSRVLIIDSQVRGLCRCLWHARALCLCPFVTTPRGVTSLSTQEAENIFSGFITTNKQTKKQESEEPLWVQGFLVSTYLRQPGVAGSSPYTLTKSLAIPVPFSSSSNRPTTTPLTTKGFCPGGSASWASPKFVWPHW